MKNTDIWTETYNSKSFLGLTLHFEEDRKIFSTTIGEYELENRHTRVYIAGNLMHLCDEWEIEKNKITAIITDGASNKTCGVDLFLDIQYKFIVLLIN